MPFIRMACLWSSQHTLGQTPPRPCKTHRGNDGRQELHWYLWIVYAYPQTVCNFHGQYRWGSHRWPLQTRSNPLLYLWWGTTQKLCPIHADLGASSPRPRPYVWFHQRKLATPFKIPWISNCYQQKVTTTSGTTGWPDHESIWDHPTHYY